MTTVLSFNQNEDISIFADYCVFVRSIYLHGKTLFEGSTLEDKDRMARTACIFFTDLNRMVIEFLILQICKITDPAKDAQGNENHTVEFLIQH